DPFDSDNGTRFETGAVHEYGIELNGAIAIEMRSKACVEYRVIFQFDDRLLAGMQTGAAILENTPAALQCARDTVFADFAELGGDIPCSAMNDQPDVTHIEQYMCEE